MSHAKREPRERYKFKIIRLVRLLTQCISFFSSRSLCPRHLVSSRLISPRGLHLLSPFVPRFVPCFSLCQSSRKKRSKELGESGYKERGEQRERGMTHRWEEKRRKVRCRSDDQKQFARGLASSIFGGDARG